MGDRDDRALVVREVPLEPRDALGVEMVRGLVEQQQVGLGEQQARERHAAALTAGQIDVTAESPGGQRSASIAWSSI